MICLIESDYPGFEKRGKENSFGQFLREEGKNADSASFTFH